MPFCKFFGQCPVCKFQDKPYEETLKEKAKRVERVLGVPVEVVASPKDRGYRGRVVFHVRKPEPGNLIIGYTLERGFVFGVDECPILEPALSSLIRKINAVMAPAPLSVWDAEKGRGKLVSLTLVGNDSGVVLSLNLRKPVFVKRLTFQIMDRIPEIVGVWWSVGTFGEHITGGRGEMFRVFRAGRETFKVTPYGEYPDNLNVLPAIWRVLRRTLGGKVVAFMTGLYVPPTRITTYVDRRGMPVKEFMETAEAMSVHPDIRAMDPGAFLMVNREMYDFVVVHVDRVKDREVLEGGKRAVLIGTDAEKLKGFSPTKPDKVYLFDVLPYTDESLIMAVY